MRYLITFTCYGQHLHGHSSGSVNRLHNLVGEDRIDVDRRFEALSRACMADTPYILDEQERGAVLDAIKHECAYRGWLLLAAHVRTTHVHAVVEAEVPPERIMNSMKSYASRALNRLCRDDAQRKRWTRHGSTRWLRHDEEVQNAIRYVVEDQGAPMALFAGECL